MAETIVEIRNANIYQADSMVLQDVNLHVERGEFVYLVGKLEQENQAF
jgi:cell division transport system ATP-binding protein